LIQDHGAPNIVARTRNHFMDAPLGIGGSKPGAASYQHRNMSKEAASQLCSPAGAIGGGNMTRI
jgi:hypothetical protein